MKEAFKPPEDSNFPSKLSKLISYKGWHNYEAVTFRLVQTQILFPNDLGKQTPWVFTENSFSSCKQKRSLISSCFGHAKKMIDWPWKIVLFVWQNQCNGLSIGLHSRKFPSPNSREFGWFFIPGNQTAFPEIPGKFLCYEFW